MTTCLTKSRAYDTALIVLDTAAAALTGTSLGVVERSVLVPGAEIPWDECQCGLLALAITNRYVSRSFPVSAVDTPHNCCDTLIVYEMSLAIVRCVPTLNADGEPPSRATMNAAVAAQEEDAFVIWTTTERTLASLYQLTGSETLMAYVINDQATVGAQGGCAGSELHFKCGWAFPC